MGTHFGLALCASCSAKDVTVYLEVPCSGGVPRVLFDEVKDMMV